MNIYDFSQPSLGFLFSDNNRSVFFGGKTHFTLSLRGVWMELILSLTPRSAGDPGQANQRIPFRWSQSLVQRWAHDSGRAREGQVAIFVGIAGKEKDSANRLSS